MGSVHPWVYAALVFLLFTGFLAERWVKRDLCVPRPAYALFALLGVVLLALIPLPWVLLEGLSPTAAEVRDFVAAGIGAVPKRSLAPLSLSPLETVLGALHHLGILLAFLLGASVFVERRRYYIASQIIGLAGGVIVLLVVLHWVLDLPEVYGFYPTKSPLRAPFINPNHLAAFLTLAGIVAIGAARQAKGALSLALAISSALSLFLILFTQSRGGTLAALVGLLLYLFLDPPTQKTKATRFALLAISIFIGAYLIYFFVLGDTALSQAKEELQKDIKLEVWRNSFMLWGDFPLFGVGRWAFSDVFPRYQNFSQLFTVRSSESLPLSIVTETGLVGLIAALVLAGTLIKTVRSNRGDRVINAILAALIALLVHDLVDFSLDIAGVAFPAALLAGSFCAQAEGRQRTPHRAFFLGILGISLPLLIAAPCAIIWSPTKALESIKKATTPKEILSTARSEIAWRPSDGYLHLATASQLIEAGAPKAALPFLNRARFLLPKEPRAHVFSARALRALGQNSQARLEYRSALLYMHPLDGTGFSDWFKEALEIAPKEAELNS